VLERLRRSDDAIVRQDLLAALGQFTDPALAERARALAFDDALRVNERGAVLTSQGESADLSPGAWAWVKKNFDALAARLPPSYVEFLSDAQGGCSEAAAALLEAEMGPRMARHMGGPYTLDKALEATRLCAARAAAQRESASRFFASRRTAPGARSSP
jgi:alanyl aminopeptidase